MKKPIKHSADLNNHTNQGASNLVNSLSIMIDRECSATYACIDYLNLIDSSKKNQCETIHEDNDDALSVVPHQFTPDDRMQIVVGVMKL